MLLQCCCYYISLNLKNSVFLSERLVKSGSRHWMLLYDSYQYFYFLFAIMTQSTLSQFCGKGLNNENFPEVSSLNFYKALASVSIPYSQQWLLPFNEKVKLGIVSRAFRTFSIEMQTLFWRLWKFWEIVGLWRCFQKNWRSFPIQGWFKFFSFQVYSNQVSSWLSLAKQTLNLNAEQKSIFFIPNLRLWPGNLGALPYSISSPNVT